MKLDFFKQGLFIGLRWVVLIALVLLLFALAKLAYLFSKEIGGGLNNFYFAITTGTCSGIAVAIFQFLLQWNDAKERDRISRLMIKNVLASRDDEEYYRQLISTSVKKVDVLGVTACRFLQDFASQQSPRPEKRVLLEAIKRGVRVRILVPDKKFLRNEQDKLKFSQTFDLSQKITHEFGSSFEIRYFSEFPSESVVIIDSDMLFGPLFRDMESKNTPTIHAHIEGDLSKIYKEYFDKRWNESKPMDLKKNGKN